MDAPSIQVTQPAGPLALGEGSDYASETWVDAWDMNQLRDIYLLGSAACGNPWPQYSGVAVSNGVWSGTVVNTSQYAPTLWLVNPSWEVGNVEIGKEGRFNPIDASRYYYLTLRMKISHNTSGLNPPRGRIRWTNGSFENEVVGSNRWSWSLPFRVFTDNQWHIYSFDLRTLPPAEGGTLTWTGFMTGLGLDPGAREGATVSVDWVRLSDADAVRTVAWTGSYQAGATVQFSLNDTPVHVYTPGVYQVYWHDPNTVSAQAGQSSFPMALPAGSYTVKASATDATGTTTSAGAGPWNVDAAPLPVIISPAATDGADWMTALAGNPWDMADTDVTSVAGVSNYWYADGQFHGQIAGGAPTCGTSDPQVQMRMRQGTIDPQRFHWLTIRMYMEGTPDLGNGWVMRVSWWENDFNTTNCGMGNDMLIEPGWHTYSLDLSRADALEPESPCNNAWTQMPNGVQHLRIDPVEAPTAGPVFHIDYVLLTEGPQAGASFDIAWTQTGMENQGGSVTLYYDTDRNPNNGKTLIAMGESLNAPAPVKRPDLPETLIPRVYLPAVFGGSAAQMPGFCTGMACAYHWNTSGVANGSYYIYIEVTDGLSTVGHYSDTPVEVSH